MTLTEQDFMSYVGILLVSKLQQKKRFNFELRVQFTPIIQEENKS